MLHRFSRTELVIGPEGLETLRKATVAVVGVGGVGSFAAEALARSGVGQILLIDRDAVDITNINRQLPALSDTVGRPKVDVMAERIRAINPDCHVVPRRQFFSQDDQAGLFDGPLHYVADAMDTISAKIDLVLACRAHGVPYAGSMGAANKIDPTAFRICDLFATKMDPIARVMRRELRKRGISQGVTVVCSEETPRMARPDVLARMAPTPAPGQVLTRKAANPPASISFVPPVAGMVLASIVIRDLTGLS